MLKTEKLTKDWVNKRLPKRPKNANKGTFGKVLVVAGSQNYPGAAYLACAASYRVGVGLATLVTTSIVETIISRKLPEVTFLLPEQAFEKLFEYDVVLLGPGLGQDESTIKFVNKLLQIKLSKMVIDGDGLNILSQTDKWWKKFHTRVILTPHPGEMSRLTGRSIADIQSDRKNIAIKYAKQWRQIVVLKGANTIIVSHDGEIKIAPFVNPALATAGTGDVLSGVIAGFIAQGLDLFDAACCGVYIKKK
ncbi:NAD(P)H-hydrate dehydratase [Candidatus Daviesbacteria bacterium]|nr:NAD(P)H-hydrate dehydratase [Candidatus Daviesbacteria bacterium]